MKGCLVKSIAMTFRACASGIKLPTPFVCFITGFLVLLHLDVFHQTFVRWRATQTCIVLDVQSCVRTVQYIVQRLAWQILYRSLERTAIQLADGLYLPEHHGISITA